jgi:hypothetical protein
VLLAAIGLAALIEARARLRDRAVSPVSSS